MKTLEGKETIKAAPKPPMHPPKAAAPSPNSRKLLQGQRPEKPELPAGWLAYWSAQYQMYYYYNPSTGNTQWEKPTMNDSEGSGSMNGSSSCENVAGWVDSQERTCEAYEEDGWLCVTALFDANAENISAGEACCTCGGGEVSDYWVVDKPDNGGVGFNYTAGGSGGGGGGELQDTNGTDGGGWDGGTRTGTPEPSVPAFPDLDGPPVKFHCRVRGIPAPETHFNGNYTITNPLNAGMTNPNISNCFDSSKVYLELTQPDDGDTWKDMLPDYLGPGHKKIVLWYLKQDPNKCWPVSEQGKWIISGPTVQSNRYSGSFWRYGYRYRSRDVSWTTSS
jgi:hypothetical protein